MALRKLNEEQDTQTQNSIGAAHDPKRTHGPVCQQSYLANLPLELRLRRKSTTHRAPINYVDLTNRTGMTMAEAVADACKISDERNVACIDYAELDEAGRKGFASGAIE